MIRTSVLFIIFGTAVVTLIPRITPLVLLSRITLPDRVVRWLGYVPIAVLAALTAQAVLCPDGRFSLLLQNHAVIAIVPVLVIAMRTKSLIGTVAGGIVVMALLRWAFG